MKTLWDWDTPPRIDRPELIDDDSQPFADFQASMKDVRRINRFLGGAQIIRRQAREWLRAEPEGHSRDARPITVLDVATGTADLPAVILAAARRENRAIRIVGLDFSAPILRLAREEIRGQPGIRLVRGDAFHLPCADASFDYVICSLAFHHFGFEQCVAALHEMERVSRRGWLVNDLRRAWSAWALIRMVSTVTRMNRLTRHDGPASVLRAYSLPEYHAMAQALGLAHGRDYHLRRCPFYRVAMVRNKR
jgi:ubiquinone/menaquinone biosynthesis C-methylase UbiE